MRSTLFNIIYIMRTNIYPWEPACRRCAAPTAPRRCQVPAAFAGRPAPTGRPNHTTTHTRHPAHIPQTAPPQRPVSLRGRIPVSGLQPQEAAAEPTWTYSRRPAVRNLPPETDPHPEPKRGHPQRPTRHPGTQAKITQPAAVARSIPSAITSARNRICSSVIT